MRVMHGKGGKGNRLLSLSWRLPAGARPRGGQKPEARGKDGRGGGGGRLPFLPKCHLSARVPGSVSRHVAREIRTAWRLGQGASSRCEDHELCSQTDF